MKVLITGVAGFIGFWVCRKLKDMDIEVVGIDNLNSYYNTALKKARLQQLGADFHFEEIDVADADKIAELFKKEKFTHVIHLAAQAGVRYSIDKPFTYSHSNLDGFLSILEAVRHYPVEHFVYASSSSVYGEKTTVPFSESARTDEPVSLYAATKKSNEIMAHSYAHLYGVPTTGLRFFTVYGEWGRPDMAPMLFAKAILEGQNIKVFNNGDMQRDFTYVGDIVEGIIRLLPMPPQKNKSEIYNIGHGSPVALMDFISTLEIALGKVAKKEFLPMQAGDVPITYADTRKLESATGYRPTTTLKEGLSKYAMWLKEEGYKYL